MSGTLKLSNTQIVQISNAIDADRLWRRHIEMAKLGARSDGGVNRQALSAADAEARQLLIRWANEHGYQCSSDAIGNIFVRREGRDSSLSPILAGSHLDTQPAGGRFDGVFGVLATLEALHALDATGIQSLRPIELVSWTNEEGSRFSPGTMGSSVFTGILRLDDVIDARDSEGIVLADALKEVLRAISELPLRPFGFPVAAYLEPHIEQGPLLEASGSVIGIVSGIQGVRWFTVNILGSEAHAGTTPRASRQDALQAAVSLLHRLNVSLADQDEALRFTVGRLSVEPNSPNTIPGRVSFTIDLRHPDNNRLDLLSSHIIGLCNSFDGTCKTDVVQTLSMASTRFDDGLISVLDRITKVLGFTHRHLTSGAFHDAKSLSAKCPSAMIFIPCAQGISHSPKESVSMEDLAAGARVLASALAELSQLDGETVSINPSELSTRGPL